jgi:lupus La protein
MVATEAEKICKQVNFYFSDSNLPYDKFLWTLRANTPEGCKSVASIYPRYAY